MTLSRRHFLSAIFASAALPTVSAFAAKERFPIFPSDAKAVPYKYRKREVDYKTKEAPGTIIIDSRKRFLYFVLGKNRAIRYGVGVGRRGSDWSGTAVIQRKAKWPTWTPTPDQLAHYKAYRKWAKGMPGGLGNPLGARALYLYKDGKDTLYRIHGTEVPKTIGTYVSSGCIRLINQDVADLFDRAPIGTKVIVYDRNGK